MATPLTKAEFKKIWDDVLLKHGLDPETTILGGYGTRAAWGKFYDEHNLEVVDDQRP